MVAGTVSKDLSSLIASFQDDEKPGTRILIDGNIDKYLRLIIKSFKSIDPKKKVQHETNP